MSKYRIKFSQGKENKIVQKGNKKKQIKRGESKINRKSGSTTVYDIAEKAGVSVSTVSKVLSSSNYKVASKTKELILEVAKELNYEKVIQKKENLIANVAVIIPNLLNPYYASLVTGLEGALQIGGMTMVLYNSRNSRNLEVKYADQLKQDDFAGVIIASICESFEHIKRMIDRGLRVLAFEQQIDLACNRVCFNYQKGGFLATEYLIQKGKNHIGFISSPLTRSSRIQVYEGFKKALKRYHVPLQEKYIQIAGTESAVANEIYEYRNGMEQAQQMIEKGSVPEAIFCINDMTAIGVIKKLQNSGYRIPKDVGIIGFDNIYFSTMISPPLTTIEQSTYELGSMAADILIGSVHDPNRNNVSIVLDPRLIIRESV